MAPVPEKMAASSEGLDEVQEGKASSKEKWSKTSEGLGELKKVLSEIPDGQVIVPKGLPETLESVNLFGLPKGQVGLLNKQNAEKLRMKAEYEVNF